LYIKAVILNTTFLKIYLVACLQLLCLWTIAASSVQIWIVDEQRSPLIGANVEIKQSENKATYFAISDMDGKAIFNNVPSGSYSINITFLGYKSFNDSIRVNNTLDRYTFTLIEDNQLLETVTVIGRKPLMTQDGDKLIVDPTPLLDMSSNTLELLEMTPGLFVDQDGGIFLGSTSAATIFINGREQRLSPQDMANLLRSLPPSSIQKIEIIRNPSARYDAASSGGILNIVLKKGMQIGRFGSINMGFNQGVGGNQFLGFNINQTGSEKGFYVNGNFSRNGNVNDLNASRQSAAPFTLFQDNITRSVRYNGFLGWGMNRELSENLTINYDGRLSYNHNSSNGIFTNQLSTIEEPILSLMLNTVVNQTPSYNQNHDLGLIWKLDTLGSEVDLKLTYAHSASDLHQDYSNEFVIPNLPTLFGLGDIYNNRHTVQFQTDWTQRLFRGLKMETGIKSVLLNFSSEADFFTVMNGQNIVDSTRINRYQYQEILSAAYLQFNKDLPFQFTLKTGIRAEHTLMDGNQIIPVDTNFVVNRIDWFPYLYLSRKITSIAGFEIRSFFIYRKTLSRPSYQNLNPQIQILDLFNYQAGNPSLLPQFTDNFELNVSVDQRPIFAIGRNQTRGIISNVLYNDPNNSSLTINTFDNIGESRENYFRLLGAIPPGGKYFFVVGGEYNILEYSGLYANDPVNFRRGSWRLFTFHSLKLSKHTKLNASGFCVINGQQNLLELGTFGQVNLSLSHQMFNNKLQLSVFGRDLFRTMVTPFRLAQSDIIFEGERYNDNQRVGATLRYNFGIKSKENKKNEMFPDGTDS
jgi:iron complex outermembrane receptor protein